MDGSIKLIKERKGKRDGTGVIALAVG